jgi:hypothetical protein
MASDPQTWAELVTALQDFMKDTVTITDTRAKQMIAFAERRFNRILRVPEMEDTVTASVSAATITLPTDFLQLRAIYLNTDPKVTLEPMEFATLRNQYSASSTGRPQNYALQSGNEIVFGPAPDGAYDLVINYYKKIPALGSADALTYNWLLLAHPDIYLFGAILQAEFFGWNDERLPMIKGGLDEMLDELKTQGIGKAHGGPAVRIRAPSVV